MMPAINLFDEDKNHFVEDQWFIHKCKVEVIKLIGWFIVVWPDCIVIVNFDEIPDMFENTIKKI